MRLRRLGLAAVTALSLLVGVGLPAHADDPADRKKRADAQVRSLQGDLDETSVRLRAAGTNLHSAQAELPGARAGVAAAERKLGSARHRDAQLATALAVARHEEQRSVRALAQVRTNMAASRQQMGAIARYAYQHGRISEVAVALSAQSPRDFADRVQLLDTTSRSQNQTLDRLADDRADIAAEQRTLTAKRAQVSGLRDEAAAQLVTTERLDRRARAAQAGVERLISAAASAQQVIEQEKADEERRLAAARAESQRLNDLLVARAAAARAAAVKAAAEAAAEAAARAAAASSAPLSSGSGSSGSGSGGSGSGGTGSGGSSSTGSSSTGESGGSGYSGGGGTLSRPVSAPISSPYGMRVHPVTGVYKLHDGTDFAAACGTPVHAAAAGTVVWTRLMSGYGNQLAIDHGVIDGHAISTSYSHLSSFVASTGQHVDRGQVVAYSGGGAGMYGAGSSTGCHVHFMVMDQAAPINENGFPTVQPLLWL